MIISEDLKVTVADCHRRYKILPLAEVMITKISGLQFSFKSFIHGFYGPRACASVLLMPLMFVALSVFCFRRMDKKA